MTIKFNNVRALDNAADGFRFEGDTDAELNGCVSEGNRGHGFIAISEGAVRAIRELQLPDGLDPKDVARLLQQLQATAPNERLYIAKASGLAQRLARLAVDVPTVLASLVTIAAYPNVHDWITRLQM